MTGKTKDTAETLLQRWAGLLYKPPLSDTNDKDLSDLAFRTGLYLGRAYKRRIKKMKGTP